MLTFDALAKPARPFSIMTLLGQIGRSTVLAISGGRYDHVQPPDGCGAVWFPVSNGYSVRITLAADDTYTVERVFTRTSRQTGTRYTIHRMTGVYADKVSDMAYNASCFRNIEFGEKVTA